LVFLGSLLGGGVVEKWARIEPSRRARLTVFVVVAATVTLVVAVEATRTTASYRNFLRLSEKFPEVRLVPGSRPFVGSEGQLHEVGWFDFHAVTTESMVSIALSHSSTDDLRKLQKFGDDCQTILADHATLRLCVFHERGSYVVDLRRSAASVTAADVLK
jgi:hypothetical protein